ncbi:MAG: hypothetical protein IPG87_10700 [Saprospiraceae bacterium]|nr:hypothetical protein [Candidatus Vicinibacter affinis]
MEYDEYGRVTNYAKAGSGNDYTSSITYQTPNFTKNLLLIPDQISVSDGSGLLRKRKVGSYDSNTGVITSIHTYTSAGSYFTTSLSYYRTVILTRLLHPVIRMDILKLQNTPMIQHSNNLLQASVTLTMEKFIVLQLNMI